jgi:hypothetical protein
LLAIRKFRLELGINALRTLCVLGITFGSQATTYAIRNRRHFLGPRPTVWLVASTVADLLIMSTLATRGIAMAPLPVSIIVGELGAPLQFSGRSWTESRSLCSPASASHRLFQHAIGTNGSLAFSNDDLTMSLLYMNTCSWFHARGKY